MIEMSEGQVCRACLQETTDNRELNNEGTDEEHELLDKFQILTDLEVKEAKAGYICTLCINNLILSFNFRKQCIESDKQIKSSQIDITVNPIKEEELSDDEIEIEPQPTRLVGYSYEKVKSALEKLRSKTNKTEEIKCLKCNFQANRRAVTSHVAKAHKEIKGKWCSRCNIIIPDLEIHLKDVHEADDKKCEFCGKILLFKRLLVNHLHRHLATRAFECQFCEKDFILNQDLLNHMKRVHKDKIIQKSKSKRSVKIPDSGFLSTEKQHLCSFCGRTFRNIGVLRVHMRLHTNEKPYKCSFCEKAYCTRYLQRVHERTHTGEKPFSCSVCNKTFSQSCLLKRHMAKHTEECCTTCNKKFSSKAELKVHMREHSREMSFSCTECGKTFAKKGILKEHMFVHSTERPFTCKTCGKSFKQIQVFNKHNLTHVKQKPLKCDQCNFSCGNKVYLKRHMRKRH